MLIRSWFISLIKHLGAGLRYGGLRLFRRGRKVSYRQIRYGSDDFSVIDHADNNLANGFLGFLVLAVITLLALTSCSNRQNLADNYSVFTYGEGLYGESEDDYPIFVSKLGYEGEPPFIPNVTQVWWDSVSIIIEQTNGSWLIITANDKELTTGDIFHGPLSIHQRDSIMLVRKFDSDKMKHRNYE